MRTDDKTYEYGGIYEDEADEYIDGDEIEVFDYPEDDEDENTLWDDEDTADTDESPERKRKKQKKEIVLADSEDADDELSEKAQRQIAKERRLIDELEADAEEHPIEDDEDSAEEQPERKLLGRELRAQALARLEDAARTQRDFENVVAWWDKLDANRERKERYHEISRSGDDVPLDYGAAKDGLFFPDTLNNVLEKQIRKGDFIDTIFYCPYDIHELVTEEYMSDILRELSEDHKFLLFLCALRQYSSTRIAAMRGQTDRNIRKVRGTMLKKIQKKLLAALKEKVDKQQPLSLLEKEFLADNGVNIENPQISSIMVIYFGIIWVTIHSGGFYDEKPV